MWKKPEYSKAEINRAGQAITNSQITDKEREHCLEVIDNWRAAHAYPMNTFAINLKRKVSGMDGVLVVQRIKRLDTICKKLERFPKMELYRMQDLGGCRVIVPSIVDVFKVKKQLEKSRIRHIPKPSKNYIANPNPETGYRGVHLIYKYRSDKNTDYNGLCIEIQIRTKLQHLWATAVEMVGVFTENGLKFNQGSEDWLKYFKLISALFAYEEGTAKVDGTPDDLAELLYEIGSLDQKLNAVYTMNTIGVAAQAFGHISEKKGAGYYLVKLDVLKGEVSVNKFGGIEKGLDEATKAYNELEKNKGPHEDVVLISAESYESLVDAYPNYFTNISNFLDVYTEIVGKGIERVMAKERAEKQSQTLTHV